MLTLALRSNTRTLCPLRMHSIAAVRPARPVPTISTSIPVAGYEPTRFETMLRIETKKGHISMEEGIAVLSHAVAMGLFHER